MTDLHRVDWEALPRPADDGAASHLVGTRLPHVTLPATDGTLVDVGALAGRSVLYVYPMTGRPGVPLPEGWDAVPGARGCTPQACAFRDDAHELRRLGVAQLHGVSTQSTEEQREAVERLHLPFALLSDGDLAFARALRLPSFEVDGRTLLRRLTMIVDGGVITHVMYPVFPPDANAREVIEWLQDDIRGRTT